MLEWPFGQTNDGFLMKLSIVILNWNAASDTIRCVQQLITWQYLQPTIWVIDNASTDDSLRAIQEACPQVRLISNTVNLGFAGGTNVGLRASLAQGEDPVLLLNNDAFISEADALTLYHTLEKVEDVGFVGPALFDSETRHLISVGGKNPVLHHQTRHVTIDAGATLQEVAYVSGTAVLIRAAVLQQVGLLDEAYFFSTELADLCTRARKAGFSSVIHTGARAYHQVDRSAQLRKTLYVYYIVRNRFIYVRKFYSSLAQGGLLLFWAAYSAALSAKLFSGGQSATAKAVYLGLQDGLRGRFGGQNERVVAFCRTD